MLAGTSVRIQSTDGLVCIRYNAVSKASRVKNIGNVLEKRVVAFRLAPPYGGLLVQHCCGEGTEEYVVRRRGTTSYAIAAEVRS